METEPTKTKEGTPERPPTKTLTVSVSPSWDGVEQGSHPLPCLFLSGCTLELGALKKRLLLRSCSASVAPGITNRYNLFLGSSRSLVAAAWNQPSGPGTCTR